MRFLGVGIIQLKAADTCYSYFKGGGLCRGQNQDHVKWSTLTQDGKGNKPHLTRAKQLMTEETLVSHRTHNSDAAATFPDRWERVWSVVRLNRSLPLILFTSPRPPPTILRLCADRCLARGLPPRPPLSTSETKAPLLLGGLAASSVLRLMYEKRP